MCAIRMLRPSRWGLHRSVSRGWAKGTGTGDTEIKSQDPLNRARRVLIATRHKIRRKWHNPWCSSRREPGVCRNVCGLGPMDRIQTQGAGQEFLEERHLRLWDLCAPIGNPTSQGPAGLKRGIVPKVLLSWLENPAGLVDKVTLPVRRKMTHRIDNLANQKVQLAKDEGEKNLGTVELEYETTQAPHVA